MAIYKLFVPKQAVGANLVYFDLFNAGGKGVDITLLSVLPVVSGEAAVVGALAVDLFLTRTSAIGTGGTANTASGSSLTACTISAYDNNQPLAAALGVTSRLTPTGGATAGAVLSFRSVFTEETAAGTYTPAVDMVRGAHEDPGIVVPGGTGIRVVQGSVASVGNIGFDVLFSLAQR